MRLERLHVRNFGCLRDRKLEFAPGVNVIRGPNEAGKSTLQAAIIAALFRRPDTTDRGILSRASWGAGETYRLDMTLAAGGKTWRIEKDFAARTARLACGEEVWQGPKTVQSVLGDRLGLSSDDLFTSTAFVMQEELAAIGEGRQEIGDLLQRRVTGGADDVAVQNVLAQLDDEIATMWRGMERPAPRNPGAIRVATTRLEEAQGALSKAQEELRDLHTTQDALAEATEREAELAEELAVEQELLKRMEERQKAEEELADADGEYKRLDKLIQTAQKLEQEASEAEAAAGALAEIAEKGPAALESIDALERTAERERGRAEQVEGEIDRLEEEAAAAPKPWPIVNPLTVAGAVLVALGVVLGIAVKPWMLAAAAVGLALLAYGVAKSRVRPPMNYDARLGELREELSEAEAAIARAADEIASTLGDLGCDSRDDLAERLRQAQEHANVAEAKRSELRGLLGGETMESLLSEQRKQLHRCDDAEERLSSEELAAVAFSPREHVELQRKIVGLEQELQSVQKTKTESTVVVGRGEVEPEEVAGLREAVASAEERLANEERRLEVYRLVREVLAEAEEETLSRAAEQLGPRTGELLAEVTRGRYDTVRIDETSLDISVFSRQKNEQIPVQAGSAELSCATREQIFLAARLALAELLWPTDPPPLLLDDPFVTFDTERRRAAAAMLQQFAEGTQVMLFTCSGFYDNLGRVITLTEAEPSEPRRHGEEDTLLA
ncbi:MAG: AAA family ATPase [Armatimonadota bacterium]